MKLGNVVLLFQTLAVAAASVLQQQPVGTFDHSQNYEFNPLLHLPGTSPYFDAVGFGLKHDAPSGCMVTAASYLIRHGAIYANDDEYDKYLKPLLWKLEQHRGGWSGDMEFLNSWHSPILEDKLEELTPSGEIDANRVGQHLCKRYPHLVGTTKRILSDKKNRTCNTARAFVKHFPGSADIELVKIKKPKDGSISPIIPHKTCKAFSKAPGDDDMATFVSIYASRASTRLRKFTPFELTPNDVLALQSICGYESAISGKRSQICGVFTDAEWMAYEYAWDMKYAHMVGPLNKLSPYLGIPWLKAQADIFRQIDDKNSTPGDGWPDGQRFFLHFTHREVPPFVATVLGIFNSSFEAHAQFPTDHIVWTRAWKMSDLIPFLGHVGLEKMTCQRPGWEGEFVRVIANTAPRPIPKCQDGPGASCPFDAFLDIIGDGYSLYGDVSSVCGNSEKNDIQSQRDDGKDVEDDADEYFDGNDEL